VRCTHTDWLCSKINACAQIDHYRRLRQADVASGGKTAYRITVRQLESLIRLAEALARLHCDAEIKPAYVNEAARLLRKSIIHVDSDVSVVRCVCAVFDICVVSQDVTLDVPAPTAADGISGDNDGDTGALCACVRACVICATRSRA
jgi:hypothetical protein